MMVTNTLRVNRLILIWYEIIGLQCQLVYENLRKLIKVQVNRVVDIEQIIS